MRRSLIHSLVARLVIKFCLFVVPAASFAITASREDRKSQSLVGTWRLVRYIDIPDGGQPIQAYGKEPIGLFIFTPDGHVSISIMRNPPDINAGTEDPDPDACIPNWYCAYFGTYTVSYARGTWVTHVLGGNIPAYLGTDQTRTFKLDGNTLTVAESYVAGSQHVRAERVLRRETKGR